MKKTAVNTPLCHWFAFIAVACMTIGCANKNFYPATQLVSGKPDRQWEQADSVTIQAGRQYQHNKFHNFFLGKHYREVWAEPVQVRVLDFEQEKGGLAVEKRSGGYQTVGLTVSDAADRTYALRSIDKDPALNKSFLATKTFGVRFLRDQTAALNPYAALVVAPLARAAGIPQPDPELVYVHGQDEALGEFKDVAGDRVYLLEEKFSKRKDLPPALRGAVDVASTKKMLRKIYEEDDHVVDQLAYAKARLFDIFINDRDRHKDQWEWAEFKEKANTVYRPVAEDRDQAFYHYNKGLTSLLLGKLLNHQKFQPFAADYRNLHALTVKSEFLDQRLLANVSKAQFDSLARELQRALPDAVIEEAVHAFPPEIYRLEGPSTIQKLKSRRDKLPEAAAGFYRILAKEVLVVGSDDEELFDVKRLNDEETEVTVHRKSDERQIYHRVFQRSETKQITLHGLGEDDEFTVSGSVKKGIVVVIVGGEGEDEIKDTSRVAGLSKKTQVYDTRIGNELELGSEARNNTSRCVTVHNFDREGF
ncbi:hypothetical protein [Botryobacter ruber]|uniref:hypothetical protein n=1 Tax=Botryobacter ruber TaxID=2171629 RepID=UPI001F0C1904|nr:hypothetical protein [Botryobacter ruber]